MLSTGDVQGCLRKLERLLRLIRFPGDVDYNGLSKGDPSAFLPLVSFALTSFSPPLAEQLMAAGLDLNGKTDLRFTDMLYKALREVFQYKPILTKQQFLQWGFSQRKISVVCDVINLVLQKHNQMKKNAAGVATRLTGQHSWEQAELPPQMSKRPFIVNHKEDSSTSSTVSCNKVTSTSHHHEIYPPISPTNGITELEEMEGDKDVMLQLSDVKGRVSAMEAQLVSLLSRLDKLRILEKRLENLENGRNTDKNEGEVIIICRKSWEELMSRVVLLETKLELSKSQEDFKDRLDSITNVLKSTSSLFKEY